MGCPTALLTQSPPKPTARPWDSLGKAGGARGGGSSKDLGHRHRQRMIQSLGDKAPSTAQTNLFPFPLPQQGRSPLLSPQITGCFCRGWGRLFHLGCLCTLQSARAAPAMQITTGTKPHPDQSKTHREDFRSCRNEVLTAGTCFTLKPCPSP